MKKKLLFFGHSGNLGSNFIYFLKNEFNYILNINEKKLYFPDVEYTYLNEKDFLKNPDYIKDKIKNISPDFILNSAACTNLDLCEKSPKKTAFVNYILPSILSKICLELKIKFIHISTDHLYKKNIPYKDEKLKISKVNIP